MHWLAAPSCAAMPAVVISGPAGPVPCHRHGMTATTLRKIGFDCQNVKCEENGAASTVTGPPLSSRGPLVSARWHHISIRGPSVSIRGPSVSIRGRPSITGPLLLSRGPPLSSRWTPVSIRGHPVSIRGPSVSIRGPSVLIRGPPVSIRGPSVSIRGPSVSEGLHQSQGLFCCPEGLQYRGGGFRGVGQGRQLPTLKKIRVGKTMFLTVIPGRSPSSVRLLGT